ncbi:ABC transporter substrate-binding protein [Virgibacillus alimentarius]|uniref:Iron complex transport system substrate-binding protein n=1 Tax=Virgibacillus alimentarius TaxID=698769 RepID=A0ABS4SA84_9BACI|nr:MULTISPECIES: ABC transporter substrate-binding protein [Virgibacillus]MBP2257915.1 iron complex transport system substrate-binding protein [Virgibacillus alimentarius]HLR69470.1 ABC transporter substrate-binding protein [Virgibacillus sp.]
MKRVLSLLLMLFLSFGLFIGCSSEDTNNASEQNNVNSNQKQMADADTDFPITVKDALDNEITMEEEPEKIVSLMPSNTEISFALGLGDKIVGVSDHDNYPEEVDEINKIGGMELNVEKIISLQPDLVLAHESGAEYSKKALQQLRDADITVFVVTDAQSIESAYTSIKNIGTITGTEDKSDDMIKDMKEGFAEIQEKTEAIQDKDRQSVFMESSPEPEIFTAGKNTFWQELLTIIHADNAAKEQEGWVQLDPEAIVELNPDVILTTYGDYIDNPVDQVLDRDGWSNVTAIKEKQVFDIDADLVSRPGPRLVDGAKEMAKVVYPEIFEE